MGDSRELRSWEKVNGMLDFTAEYTRQWSHILVSGVP